MKKITKQKNVELESKNSNNLWQITLDAMSEAVFLIDLEHKILQCNKATLALLGKSDYNEIIGHPCGELVHGTSGSVDWCPVRRMWESGHKESDIQLLEGKWVEISGEPIFNDEGEIFGAIHIITDINSRKKAEDALKESEQQYLTILNSLNDAMHVADKDLRIIFQNPAMIRWLEELNLCSNNLGKSVFEAFPFLDYNKVDNEYDEVFKSRKLLINTEATKLSNQLVFTETLKIPIIHQGEVNNVITILRDITDQKEAEEKLKVSEEKYRNIVNNLMDIIIILDLKGNFQYISPQIYDISGFKAEEIIGKSGFKFMHPDDMKYAAEVLKEAIEKKKKMYIEYRTIHKDGHYINVAASGRLIHIEGENRIFAVVRDISDQKRAEQKLKESEEKYRYLIENALEGVWVIDSNADTILVNPSMVNILGYSVEEMIGKSVFSFIDENQAKKTAAHLERRKQGISEERDAEFIHKNGKKVYLRVRATPIFNNEGIYEGTYAFLADITQRKVAEKKIKESEEKYRHISENAYDLITIFDENFTYEYINEKPYLNLLGYTADDLIGKTGIDFLHPDEKEKIIEQFKKVITEGSASVFVRLKHKLGHYIWTDTIGTLFFDKDGNRKVIAITRDVTDRITAEEELKKSEVKHRLILEKANDLISILNIDFKHEYINEQAYIKLLGYTKDDLIGQTPFIFLHPDDTQKVANILREGFNKGSGESVFRFKCKSGQYKWLESRGTTFFDTKREKKALIISRDISESREADQRLRESEDKFRTITEQSFMGIIILQDGVFKYFNEQAAKMNGYSMKEIKNWKPFEFQKLIYPDDREFVMEQARKKQAGDPDVVSHYKYRIIKKNGDVIWVENFSKTINYRGKPADFVMTIDISDKIITEQNLKESEEKYRLISENTDDLIVVYNEDGLVEYLNAETHSRVLGYTLNKFLDKSFRDVIVHEDDRVLADRSGSEGLEKGNFQYQFRIKHYNGYYLWFEVTGKKFVDNDGNKKILCVSRNINEKKLAEQKIKESEKNFRTIAEQAFIGTLIIQEDKVEYVNNALLQIFEFSHDEIKNWRKIDLIKLIYPEDLQYLRESREKLRAGESDIKQFYSYRVFTKYGKIKWIDQFSRPIIYRGKPAELVTIMDITEKKKAEEELIKLNSLKSELLRRTSHELKTPLVSIKGFSELLLTVHREKLDDYVLATIREIKLGCERLENLIQDILKTAELESESVELKKSEEDLSFLIKLCVRELQGLTRLRNHEINLDIHDKLITKFEPDQIHLVLSNLINNAIKYTPSNGKIQIKSAITDDYILISIEDNGIGVTSEEKKRLFTQFGKIERYGQGLDIISDGSGLGLFITKKIIELHGGTIRVKSKGRNKGSTFYFTLPIITDTKD